MSSYHPMIDQIADVVAHDDDYRPLPEERDEDRDIVPFKLEDWHRDLSDYCHPNTLEYSALLARRLHSALETIEDYKEPDIDNLAKYIGRSIIENVIAAGIRAKHLEKI